MSRAYHMPGSVLVSRCGAPYRCLQVLAITLLPACIAKRKQQVKGAGYPYPVLLVERSEATLQKLNSVFTQNILVPTRKDGEPAVGHRGPHAEEAMENAAKRQEQKPT